MFCQNCGTQIQPGQQFCSKCSMPLVGYAPQQKWRLQRHLHLLGIFWIAYSAVHALAGIALMIVANIIFGHRGVASGAPEFLQPLLATIGILLLIKSVLGVAVTERGGRVSGTGARHGCIRRLGNVPPHRLKPLAYSSFHRRPEGLLYPPVPKLVERPETYEIAQCAYDRPVAGDSLQ